MTTESQLHPAVMHHVVNTLGWTTLRPLQQAAVEPLLAGEHALLLAPTAGGKTEAAVFPLLSRMLSEDWRGLKVLYICPLRALLNNLHERLDSYFRLVGRTVGLWHGDVGQAERGRILAEPPDLLLTTPESIESMLVSRRVDERHLFRGVRVAVVDEIHAFAGDDRGWHLLAVLERVQRLTTQPIQRVGLSATVGNPDALLEWFTASSSGPARVLDPPAEARRDAEITLDYVGDIGNAATVIARLHRGEKRLVFADSRARVERLGHELRQRDVTTFLSHGSLGREERRRAEVAFASERDCVIVATSTLELGIDIGDLDRVIQIDASTSVAAFLQRLGRTGRRAETVPNMLFLATSDDALLQAAALTSEWEQGRIEPLTPPAFPAHLVAQQVLALALQEGAVGRRVWPEWLGEPFLFGADVAAAADNIVEHMLDVGLLHDDQGLLGVGRTAEDAYGRRHFLELLSTFTAPPVFSVFHGQTEIGQIPDTTLQMAEQGQRVVLLAGRSWFVRHIDWRRRVIHVEPSDKLGLANWFGDTVALPASLCRTVRKVLAGTDPQRATLSKRARAQLSETREAFGWIDDTSTALVEEADGSWTWWTFAGLLANAWLSAGLGLGTLPGHNLKLRLPKAVSSHELVETIARLDLDATTIRPLLSVEALRGLKFSDCLPEPLALDVLERRLDARVDVATTLAERLVVTRQG